MDLQDVVRLRKAGVEYSEIAKRFEKERVHPAFSEMPGEPGYGRNVRAVSVRSAILH
jgi:hypothetical protein